MKSYHPNVLWVWEYSAHLVQHKADACGQGYSEGENAERTQEPGIRSPRDTSSLGCIGHLCSWPRAPDESRQLTSVHWKKSCQVIDDFVTFIPLPAEHHYKILVQTSALLSGDIEQQGLKALSFHGDLPGKWMDKRSVPLVWQTALWPQITSAQGTSLYT